jgi:hypothetical protein
VSDAADSNGVRSKEGGQSVTLSLEEDLNAVLMATAKQQQQQHTEQVGDPPQQPKSRPSPSKHPSSMKHAPAAEKAAVPKRKPLFAAEDLEFPSPKKKHPVTANMKHAPAAASAAASAADAPSPEKHAAPPPVAVVSYESQVSDEDETPDTPFHGRRVDWTRQAQVRFSNSPFCLFIILMLFSAHVSAGTEAPCSSHSQFQAAAAFECWPSVSEPRNAARWACSFCSAPASVTGKGALHTSSTPLATKSSKV